METYRAIENCRTTFRPLHLDELYEFDSYPSNPSVQDEHDGGHRVVSISEGGDGSMPLPGDSSILPGSSTGISLNRVSITSAATEGSRLSPAHSNRRKTSSCDYTAKPTSTEEHLKRVIRHTIKQEFKQFTEQFKIMFDERVERLGSSHSFVDEATVAVAKETERAAGRKTTIRRHSSNHVGHTPSLSQSPSVFYRSEQSMDGDDIPLKEQLLIEAITSNNLENVDIALGGPLGTIDANPNFVMCNYSAPGSSKKMTTCNMLAAAVMQGNVDIVHALVESEANVNEKEAYSFSAGMRGMTWKGAAMYATIRAGTADIEMLQTLIDLRADPRARSSNGANLVWQSCYFGHVHMLNFLLEQGVPFDEVASSQHKEKLSHTPLHIASMQDRNTAILEKLIAAKANIDVKNEENKTPLLDAILLGRIHAVRVLVSSGARLVTTGSYPDEDRPLDSLFQKANPLLLKNAAMGLYEQERQLLNFTIDDLYKFLNCPQSKAEILKALFKKRQLRYWDERIPGEYVMKTAHVRNSKIVNDGKFHRFVNVAASSQHSAIMESQLKLKKDPRDPEQDPDMKIFLDELENTSKDPWRRLARNLSGETLTFTSVETFESVVPNFHDAMRIIKAIADSSAHEGFFEMKACEAILQYAWKGIRLYSLAEFVLHLALLCLCLGLAYDIGKSVTCDGCDQSERITLVAACGVPLNLLFLLREVARVAAYAAEGFQVRVVLNRICASSLMDMVLLCALFLSSAEVKNHFWFRLVYSVNCIFRWLNLVNSLAPVRRIGIRLVPIIYAVSKVGPFLGIFVLCIMTFTTALVSLGLEQSGVGDTFLNVFLFGSVTEPEFLADTAFMVGWPEGFLVRAAFATSTFFVSITMMNCYIAAMTASYKTGDGLRFQLYQVRLAGEIVKHFATRNSLRRLCGRMGRQSDGDRYLWYAVKPDR